MVWSIASRHRVRRSPRSPSMFSVTTARCSCCATTNMSLSGSARSSALCGRPPRRHPPRLTQLLSDRGRVHLVQEELQSSAACALTTPPAVDRPLRRLLGDPLVHLVVEVGVVAHRCVDLRDAQSAPLGARGDRRLARKARVLQRLDHLPHVRPPGQRRASPRRTVPEDDPRDGPPCAAPPRSAAPRCEPSPHHADALRRSSRARVLAFIRIENGFRASASPCSRCVQRHYSATHEREPTYELTLGSVAQPLSTTTTSPLTIPPERPARRAAADPPDLRRRRRGRRRPRRGKAPPSHRSRIEGIPIGQQTRQIAVDHPRALATLVDRPHDQRLPAARIARGEHSLHRSRVGLHGLHVATRVLLHAKLVEQGLLGVQEAHRQQHQLRGQLALGAGHRRKRRRGLGPGDVQRRDIARARRRRSWWW